MKWLVEDSDLTEEDLEEPAARIDRGPPRRRMAEPDHPADDDVAGRREQYR